MTDKGSKKPQIDLEDVTELDDLDVPTTNIYTRTGKAAPTEVLPSAPKNGNTENTGTTAKSDKAASSDFAGKPELKDDAIAPATGPAMKSAKSRRIAKPKPVDIEVRRVDEAATAADADEPVAASTVSTAGTLHTTETAESLDTGTVAADATADTLTDAPQPPIGRGTIDVGLLILRLVVGAVLIITSLAILFQLGGNSGLAGLEDELSSHAYPRALAIALPTMGLASGVFLVLGLLTPIAAMIAVAATGFGAIHAVDTAANATDLFAWEPSIWLAFSLLGMALAVQFTGPGVFGVDFSRSWTRRPMTSSWICAAVGIAAAILMWWFA